MAGVFGAPGQGLASSKGAEQVGAPLSPLFPPCLSPDWTTLAMCLGSLVESGDATMREAWSSGCDHLELDTRHRLPR